MNTTFLFRGSALLFFSMILGCANSNSLKSDSYCFTDEDYSKEVLEKEILENFDAQVGSDVISAGKSIYKSFNESVQRDLDSAALKSVGRGNFYEKIETALSDDVAFSKYFSGCKNEHGDYERFLLLDWMLSVVGGELGVYDKGHLCAGYCSELAEIGDFNATEKLKISLYAYLYWKAVPGTSNNEAIKALGFPEKNR